MTDRRRKIAALRAKADSTTFPAERESLLAKAAELEGQEPPRTPPKPPPAWMQGNAFDVAAAFDRAAKDRFSSVYVPRPGEGFGTMGGYRTDFTGDASKRFEPDLPPAATYSGRTFRRDGKAWMRVTSMNGTSRWERID